MATDHDRAAGNGKLGTVSGVYIPVCLNILSILMFLRFGQILGQVGFIGILGEQQVKCNQYFLAQFQPAVSHQVFFSPPTASICSPSCPSPPLPPMEKSRAEAPTT